MQTATQGYPSRNGGQAAILPRREPVVYGTAVKGGALSSRQLLRYRRDGFIVLRNLFSASEVGAFVAEARNIASQPRWRGRDEVVFEPGSDALRSLFMAHRLSDLYQRLASDWRLVDVASQLLGSGVYVHQSRLNLKPGFDGREFYWHSDFETWHIEDGMPAMRALSCTILLSDNSDANGPLMLIPGSHLHFVSCVGETPADHYRDSLRRQEYGVPDRESLAQLAGRGGIRTIREPAGTVVFFDCNVLHGSNSNISPQPRHNLFFVYNSVENRLVAPNSGQLPRPEHVATREDAQPLLSQAQDYSPWMQER